MRKTITLVALALLVSTSGACGQVLLEHFRYPPGTVVPNWTEVSGDWKVIGQGLQTYVMCDKNMKNQFLSRDNLPPVNGVVEATVFTTVLPAATKSSGGVFARGRISALPGYFIAAVVADTVGRGDFDTFIVGESPGTMVSTKLPKPSKRVQIRLVFYKGQAIGRVDIDMDGLFDLSVPVKVQQTATPVLGTCGLLGQASVAIDNFNFYDALLLPRNRCQIGRNYQMHLWATPLKPVPVAEPYVCGCAFFASPKVQLLQSYRFIPIFPGPLTLLSLGGYGIFMDFSGFLNNQSEATPHIRVPDEPSIVGLGFFTTGLTLDARLPDGIANIAQNLHTTILK